MVRSYSPSQIGEAETDLFFAEDTSYTVLSEILMFALAVTLL